MLTTEVGSTLVGCSLLYGADSDAHSKYEGIALMLTMSAPSTEGVSMVRQLLEHHPKPVIQKYRYNTRDLAVS